MIASLPMYDWPEVKAQTDAFWRVLRSHFLEAGFDAPETLNRGEEGGDWLSSDLLFSQTCGYPFATQLRGKVQLLATPHYNVEGCDGPTYSSALLVHRDSRMSELIDTKGKTFAYNGLNSLSGFRCLTPVVGNPKQWFGKHVESGSHRTSAKMVAEGKADVAAIDAVCWHLFQKFEPELADNLKVLRWTPQLPSLPFITSNGWNDDELARLRGAVLAGLNAFATQSAIGDLAIQGGSILGEEAYDIEGILAMTLIDRSPREVYETSFRGVGSLAVSPTNLEGCLDYFREKSHYVSSMEAHTLAAGFQTPNFEFAILGLDGEENWENHASSEAMFDLVCKKIRLAKNHSDPVALNVWLNELPS